MATPSEIHMRHLLDISKYLQPLDPVLAHTISHRAARQAVQITGSAAMLRNHLCPRCHYLLQEVDKPPEEERCPKCFVEFTRRAKQPKARRRKRRRDEVPSEEENSASAEEGMRASSDKPTSTDAGSSEESNGANTGSEKMISAVLPASNERESVAALDSNSIVADSLAASAKSASARRRDRKAASKGGFAALVSSEAAKGGGASSSSLQLTPAASAMIPIGQAAAPKPSLSGIFDSWGDILGLSKPATVSSSSVLSVPLQKPTTATVVVTEARKDLLATGKASKKKQEVTAAVASAPASSDAGLLSLLGQGSLQPLQPGAAAAKAVTNAVKAPLQPKQPFSFGKR